jgi:hypothetical protein
MYITGILDFFAFGFSIALEPTSLKVSPFRVMTSGLKGAYLCFGNPYTEPAEPE